MSKSTGNKVKIERWNIADPQKRYADNRVVVTKIAVRDPKGRFHGATNFKGSFLDK